MARPARFERATFRLGGGCSIQLSYGRIFEYIVAESVRNVNEKDEISLESCKISKIPLYRMTYLGYNKPKCANFS